jgi:hypothetical protein
MTEEEAKVRKCWIRTEMHCLGSKCMAWRWDELHDPRELELWSKSKNRRVTGAVSSDAEWRPVNPDEPLPPQPGTCGALRD